jgi:hypothetical protein
MPTRRALLLASLTLAGLAAGVPAQAAGSLVDVQIVDRHLGQVLPAYRHRGVPYVAGQPGHRYAVRMVNRTGARVLVVLSVDGINAISGETAAVNQTGYVLAPYASAEITGWRKSMTEAAAFYFTSLADSYAARTDRPDNVGVIGVAIYRERAARPEPRPYEPPWSSSSRESETSRDAARGAGSELAERRAPAAAEPAPSTDAARPSAMPAPESPAAERQRADSIGKLAQKAERLGTGHGEREHAPITHTAFERASNQPNEIVRVRYDSHANLVAMGVIRAARAADRAAAVRALRARSALAH